MQGVLSAVILIAAFAAVAVLGGLLALGLHRGTPAGPRPPEEP